MYLRTTDTTSILTVIQMLRGNKGEVDDKNGHEGGSFKSIGTLWKIRNLSCK